ncbi:NTF2 fold immunity protein of polymorphic toxin system component [Acinetobacter calcoaceticus]|uniref:NTF2 fold immunity protein of polymorphic toxin system component n=1 Tax=Acinetobacter calcoaceticus TaxID=471 RepID=A0A4R1XED7_ACICA|nr:NTF2 fold immunity protein of polymorphic toxin system component [Acinetobacter calcoaceticus]
MNDPKQTLFNFIKEMREWEVDYDEIVKISDDNFTDENIQKNKLNKLFQIHQKYLSDKALSSKQDRYITLSFGVPPEYDQEITNEKIINRKKIEFETSRKGDLYRVYTLILENDFWKVDKMAISSLDWRVSRQVF